jgi:hypothetical protein
MVKTEVDEAARFSLREREEADLLLEIGFRPAL